MDKIKQFILSNQDKKYRDFTLTLILKEKYGMKKR